MTNRVFLAAFLACALMAGASFGQTKPDASVFKLKNVAATDAAKALTAYADEKKWPVTVVAEPVSNSVMAAGDAVSLKLVTDLLTKLDKPLPSAVISAQFLSVPVEFAEEIGLANPSDEKTTEWVLTARELRMLTAATRAAKEKKTVVTSSRPQMIVTDNQTAFYELDKSLGTTLRATPRLMPDSSILVRYELQFVAAGTVQTVESTVKVGEGGTVVVRGPQSKTEEKGSSETLMILTINRVNQTEK